MDRIRLKKAKDLRRGLKQNKASLDCLSGVTESRASFEFLSGVYPNKVTVDERRRLMKAKVEITLRAFDALSEKEKMILREFYIDRKDGYIEHLTEKLCCEKSTLYRFQREALLKFAGIIFGYGSDV